MRPLVICLLLLTGCARPSHERINVLLIVVDTLRADRVGCYGADKIDTPAIDELARRGLRFGAAFTQASFTLPSISSLLTSLYPYRHQVRNNQTNLHDQYVTLAEVFHDAGFETGAVLGSAVLVKERNLTQGFDHYDDQFPKRMEVYNPVFRKRGIPLGDRAQRRAEGVTSLSLGWLDEHGKEPFFLLAHYFDPHSKYDPPPPFREQYELRAYDGEVAYTDREIGRLLDGLRSRRLEKRTLVVLVADHGESLGDHGEAEHGFFVYEPTIRVPLVMRLPGVIPEGEVENRLVRLVDIFPTVIDLAGLESPDGLDGQSLVPLFEGGDVREVPVYSEAFLGYFGYGWSPTRSIRTPDWKYVDAPRREFYDLRKDPSETTNLYESAPPECKRLEALMGKHLRAERETEQHEVATGEIGEEQRERLEALGYWTRGVKTPRDGFAGLPDPKDEVSRFEVRQLAKSMTTRARPWLAAGDFEKGEKFLKRALALLPNHQPALELLAAIKMLGEECGEAERIYRQILEVDSLSTRLRADLAIAIANQNRLGEAIEMMERCAELDPDNPRYLGILRTMRQAHAQHRPLSIRFQYDFTPANTEWR